MVGRNGAGLTHRGDDGEARKVVGAIDERHPFLKADQAKTQATAPQDGQTGFLAVGAISSPARGEERDDFPVLAALSPRWRVIAGKCSLQWIFQRRGGGADSWRGQWFCQTKEALIRGARAQVDHIGGDALVILLHLPDRFPDNGGTITSRQPTPRSDRRGAVT